MESCGDIAACLVVYAPRAFDAAFAIIAGASAIAALTPTPRDDAFVARVYRIIDLLALNVGHAKDKSEPAGGRFVPK